MSEWAFLNSVLNYEFARTALAATVLVGLICGILSPAVVLKNKSYVADTLSHLVFPGVIAGYFCAQFLGWPLWICLFVGAAVSGLLGHALSEFILKKLKVPPDSAAVVTLTGFFGAGVIAVSRQKGTRIDLDRVLFGDVLTLEWADAGVLLTVLLIVFVSVYLIKNHWNAWLSDEEFAKIAGFKINLINRLFPILMTLTVLTGMFAVGGLMISALLVLPAVLVQPRRAFDLRVIFVSLLVCVGGVALAFQFDWPLGSAIVVLGFCLVLVKGIAVSLKP